MKIVIHFNDDKKFPANGSVEIDLPHGSELYIRMQGDQLAISQCSYFIEDQKKKNKK